MSVDDNVLGRLRSVSGTLALLEAMRDVLIARALTEGRSMADVGRAAGMTRQSIHQRSVAPSSPAPDSSTEGSQR